MKNKALFLDRDGVINHDPGDYTFSLGEFELLPDTISSMKIAHEKNYLIIVITNQGGIAKGLYTHEVVKSMHDHLRSECLKNGFDITRIFYSPHHPDFGNSLTRKPESLMLERAFARYDIDIQRSLIIGDRDRDIECAAKVGVKGILIPTNSSFLKIVESLD